MSVITVKEAAQALRVDPETIRVGLRNGSFPVGCAIKMGRRYNYIIPAAAFRKFMEVGKVDVEDVAKAF
jgi:hypothetical protein